MENNNLKDEKLWIIAGKRAKFKKHLLSYIVINVFLWGTWLIGSIIGRHSEFAWPVFVTFGWGIGLTVNYIRAYTDIEDTLTEKEYQKLISKHGA